MNGKLRVVTILVASVMLVAPALSSLEHGVRPDFYVRAATGVAVNPTQQLTQTFEKYDWTAGLDLGLGIRIGIFHAGAAAGIRYFAPGVVAVLILSWLSKNNLTSDTTIIRDLPRYADWPLRFYAGIDIVKRFSTRLDAFWGWYLRASKDNVPHSANDFEAGIAIRRKWVFAETSYVWPRTKKLRVSIGGQWSF